MFQAGKTIKKSKGMKNTKIRIVISRRQEEGSFQTGTGEAPSVLFLVTYLLTKQSFCSHPNINDDIRSEWQCD